MQNIRSLAPRVSKRYLLLIAALAWTMAGTMLLARGLLMSGRIRHTHWIMILLSILGGGMFYLVLFSKISASHVSRILGLQNERQCIFSFFNLRSYLLMTIMISSGIILRKTGFLYTGTLSLVYITMGIPLLLSSIRFFYHWITYPEGSYGISDE
jgi:uncharacterized membrane protein